MLPSFFREDIGIGFRFVLYHSMFDPASAFGAKSTPSVRPWFHLYSRI